MTEQELREQVKETISQLKTGEQLTDDFMELIKQYVSELISSDEECTYCKSDKGHKHEWFSNRNRLRAELREKAGLKGEEQTKQL